MDELEPRLARCFSALFPQLRAAEIPGASAETLASWDSVATVTLMNLIEEEFGIPVAPEDVERLVSFQSALAYVQERARAA